MGVINMLKDGKNIMDVLGKYNRKPRFNYDNEKERSYINLQGLVEKYGKDKVYTVHALFINTKSRFGEAPIIVTDDYIVNAPKHLLDIVKTMINDVDIINLVNERKVGFKIYSYYGRYGKGYSVEWVQI